MNRKPAIDILIIVAARGGVENVVNATALYLMSCGYPVRIVQIVDRHVRWPDERIPFVALREREENQSLEEFIDAYRSFMESAGKTAQMPDIVLACAWPYTAYIARRVAIDLKLNYRIISWLHNNPLQSYIECGFGTNECMLCADAHLAISNEIACEIKRLRWNSPVYRIYNPVDFANAPDYINEHQNDEKKTLWFIGRLTVQKSIHTLIEAIALSHSNYDLFLVVEGEEGENTVNELKKLAEKRGVTNRIHFTGWKSDPWSIVRDAVALLIASSNEGGPLVAIEALSRGIPVIATPVGVLPEIIRPGENGYLFPHEDPVSLARILDAMQACLLPEIHADACISSVRIFERESALNGFAEQIEKIHQQICENNQNR